VAPNDCPIGYAVGPVATVRPFTLSLNGPCRRRRDDRAESDD